MSRWKHELEHQPEHEEGDQRADFARDELAEVCDQSV